MRRSLIPLLRPFDRLLQLCLPVSPGRVSYLSRPDYCDNAFHMYRHLLTTRNDLEHVWSLMDLSLSERVQREFRELSAAAGTTGNSLRIVGRGSPQAYWLYLTSRSVFHTHGVYPISDRALRGRQNVCLWHGMPIKCIGRLNHRSPRLDPTFGTHHVASSHFFKYIIARAFGADANTVMVTGLPRCDSLTHAAAVGTPRAEVRRRLQVPEGKKLVLWLPTYRTEGIQAVRDDQVRSFFDDLQPWTVPALAEHSLAHDCVIVAKLHPRDPLNYYEVASPHPDMRLLKAKDWVAQGIQLYDLLAAADGLLSDVSSVLIDFLVTERPIGVVGFDHETYTRDLTFPIDVILDSRRFVHVDGPAAAKEFFRLVGSGQSCRAGASDVAHMLYESPPEMSAELIARQLGL